MIQININKEKRKRENENANEISHVFPPKSKNQTWEKGNLFLSHCLSPFPLEGEPTAEIASIDLYDASKGKRFLWQFQWHYLCLFLKLVVLFT